jgi:hypothetical protein
LSSITGVPDSTRTSPTVAARRASRKSAFGQEKFFFETELEQMYHEDMHPESAFNLE